MTRNIHCSAACLIALAVLLAGCAETVERRQESMEKLIQQRTAHDERNAAAVAELNRKNVQRLKAEYDASVAGRGPAPVVDILAISGGGDWGAFGAGYLKGWGKITGELTRPREFDAVTGVSTGALIAPFAFLGDDASIERVVSLYRNPKENWVQGRGLLKFLSGSESYAQIPGLEKELDEALDLGTLKRIADGGAGGRVVAVNTTELDMEAMRVWDLTAQAKLDVEEGKSKRVRQILLASSALPGIFPPRIIDDALYVDGGVTGNVIFGGRARSDDSFMAQWKAAYPDMPLPKVRYWVIFNNEVRWPPEVVQPKWAPILAKASTASTRSATLNAIRLLFARAEIARLRDKADVEVRFVAVPDGWVPPVQGVFNRETMNALADLGEKMGADSSSWRTDPP